MGVHADGLLFPFLCSFLLPYLLTAVTFHPLLSSSAHPTAHPPPIPSLLSVPSPARLPPHSTRPHGLSVCLPTCSATRLAASVTSSSQASRCCPPDHPLPFHILALLLCQHTRSLPRIIHPITHSERSLPPRPLLPPPPSPPLPPARLCLSPPPHSPSLPPLRKPVSAVRKPPLPA